MKYKSAQGEDEMLPNILGLTDPEDIAISEFEGFLKAEIVFTEKLTLHTRFDLKYILELHKLAVGHLYSFAGRYREVNLSKGGFAFPAARFLPASMNAFEVEILSGFPDKYGSREELIRDIAKAHAELLFIHPFREGNGRTARALANLMARKQGYPALQFAKVGRKEFKSYVLGVQSAAGKEYETMEKFIASIFPG